LKKALVIFLAVGLAVALFAIVGCGSDKTTIKTPEGEVTVEEDGGTITFEGEEGSGTIDLSDKPPTEAELGAPVYPDAEYVEGSGGTMTGTGEEGEFATAAAEFKTKDSFGDVVDWYTGELGQEPFSVDTDGQQEASWLLGDDETNFITVTVTEVDGEVVIGIVRMSGSE